MSDDLEERFRQACSAYVEAAHEADQWQERQEIAAAARRDAEKAADRARDQLLQVVRERDAAAQLSAYGPAGGPVGDGLDEQRRAHYGIVEPVAVLRAVTTPEDTDYWARHGGMCPECGISWRLPSAGCPHRVVNWHPNTP